jgi:predicted anti-sigma-YlaC factor YlaD
VDLIRHEEGSVYQTAAPNWLSTPGRTELNIAITPSALKRRMNRGFHWQLGQLYGIIGPGAISADLVFQGLRRRMFVADDPSADAEKLAVVWQPKSDFCMEGDPFDPHLATSPAPDNSVFVTYLSPNRMTAAFSNVDAWIEHWAWVDEDPVEKGHPIEWRDRYESCAWARG